MVRKIVRGLRAHPMPLLIVIVASACVLVAVVFMRPATAYSYTPPQLYAGTNPLCTACSGCGCEAPGRTPEGVNPLDGTIEVQFLLCSDVGRTGLQQNSLRWSSAISGETEMGTAILPSWMWTIHADG